MGKQILRNGAEVEVTNSELILDAIWEAINGRGSVFKMEIVVFYELEDRVSLLNLPGNRRLNDLGLKLRA